ncbi:MAG: low molecular weight phosphotyrosine protein phosphatase [Bacteroidetes bacterium]|nr:MAG: low molecular weight phosphotyrosine protein phosphatase [Bacteroidota bacterium]
MKILMVCLGNICRSPLAEGIMQRKIEENGLPWKVDSAGTSSWHIGEPPDRRSIEVAKKHGIDIAAQRGRQIRQEDLSEFDFIYAMDTSNFRDILKLANSPEQEEKVKLILNETTPNEDNSVPDPYWDDDGFENVYQLLHRACQKIIENNFK